MIVENKLTPLSRNAASVALLAAYRELTGGLPSTSVLALLLAQSAFETGHWRKIHNFNFGNAKAGPNYPLIVQFRCSEVDEHGDETFYDPPDPHCNFRAYNDATAGALDYLKVLRGRPHWWQGLHTEDPEAFVDALATPPKYFTGNVGLYKRSIVSLFGDFHPLAEVALAVAAAAPASRPVAPALAASVPSSSSDSLLSASSGAPPAPPNTAGNGTSSEPVPPLPPPPSNGKQSPRTPAVPEATLSFWAQVIAFMRWLAELIFRLRPPRPPGGRP